MKQFQEDLKTLGIDIKCQQDLAIRDVITAFRKKAKLLHPDKVGDKYTAEFQDLKLAYERTLKFLVDKREDKVDIKKEDEEKLTEDNFDLFNFPKKNTDSFTVQVENHLADLWQESFEKLFGKPTVNKNKTTGTESGRVWKLIYGEQNCELTIHFYNKPISSKKSKFLVQGGSHAAKYLFVFDEMPKIYKMVLEMAPKAVMTPMKHLKRRRLSTSTKKRNVRHKPALKENSCALCPFSTVSNVKMIRHMKTTHTSQTRQIEVIPKILDEDMSLCEETETEDEKLPIEDKRTKSDEELDHLRTELLVTEEIPEVKKDIAHISNKVESQIPDSSGEVKQKDKIENKLRESCEFSSKTKDDFVNHIAEDHTQVNHSSFYKCNECVFIAATMEELKVYKKKQHVSEQQKPDNIFLHSCISCKFQTNIYNDLNTHIAEYHGPEIKQVVSHSIPDASIPCSSCDHTVSNRLELEWHIETEHSFIKCTMCDYTGETEVEIRKHIASTHEPLAHKCSTCQRIFNQSCELEEHTYVAGNNIRCEQCNFKAETISVLVTHLLSVHGNNVSPEQIDCAHCDFRALDKQKLKDHMESDHWELSFMSHIVTSLDKSSQNFETFKEELTKILNIIIEDHNTIKQELFIHRQNNHQNVDRMKKIETGIETLTNTINSSKFQVSLNKRWIWLVLLHPRTKERFLPNQPKLQLLKYAL